jgi:hypothetical protein
MENETEMRQQIVLLEQLAESQNRASQAVITGDLTSAHFYLKRATIDLFSNAGDDKVFTVETAVRLYLIFFRAAFYLENPSGEYAYRYEAIPGQLGNACHFQLGLSHQDASGYAPPASAVQECASAAHVLLSRYAERMAVQTIEQRKKQLGISYPKEDLCFTYSSTGYPIVRIIDPSRGEVCDFSRPRFFDFRACKTSLDSRMNCGPSELLRIVERCCT